MSVLETQIPSVNRRAPREASPSPTPDYAKLLLAQARTVFESADSSETWEVGRRYLRAAVQEGSSDACLSMAYCHLTGENGFEIDPAAALEYMNSWRRHALRDIHERADRQHLSRLEMICQKFAALWRRCSIEVTSDAALALMGRVVIGYRMYRRFPGTDGPKSILVLELDDGSEVEIINHYGTINTSDGCVAGGRREVDTYMQNHWSSRLSASLGWDKDEGGATAVYNNYEFEVFNKWSTGHEIS